MANENTASSMAFWKYLRQSIAPVFGLGLILAVTALLYSPGFEGKTDPLLGNLAPDFEFETFLGERQSLSGFRGKVVLVHFWAFWCDPCREEMPLLKRLEQELAGEKFVLLMVHVGEEKEEALRVAWLPSTLGFHPPDSAITAYRVSGLPHSFLVDRKGIIRATYAGPRDWVSSRILKEIREPLGS